ncbi:BrnA antitoxin family protein [Candidatus Palauibacter sp.]|uniref:BrnA antitoxin family protein n=1 Tax=Candidatus Palauibacter sp. TaxID=3101350 RepID=UPI003D1063D6
MNEKDNSTGRDFDPDTAPDLSKDGWPEKFAEAPVRRGGPPKAPVRRGRPPKARPKISTTIRLSPEVIDHFRAGGRGWQTRIDEALREWIKQHDVA